MSRFWKGDGVRTSSRAYPTLDYRIPGVAKALYFRPDFIFTGPTWLTSFTEMDSELSTWLDTHKDKPIVFVSFGSVVTPNDNDLKVMIDGIVDDSW